MRVAHVTYLRLPAGPEFEKRILANESGNAKFNFLKEGDPYNAYYRRRIDEISAAERGEVPEAAPAAPAAATPAPPPAVPPPAAAKSVLPPTKPLAAPEEPHYTAPVPEGLSLMDVDIIKLTAQFVARNGKSFLTGLASREHSNPQFNFLKPTHSLFSFFTRLCDAYSRCLMPPKGTVQALKADVEERSAPLQRALNRLEWERVRDREAQDAENAEEAERQALQAIDWHDFVVVETIDFEDGEEGGLPLPMTLKEVLQLARAGKLGGDGAAEAEDAAAAAPPAQLDAEEAALVAEGAAAAAPPPASPPADDGDVDMDVSDEEDAIRVVKNYKRVDPRRAAAEAQDASRFVVSPITGELVPIEQMAEHMRVSLIDPKWKTQRDTMLAKIKETTRASDDEIGRNLSLLARTRPDVFGSAQDEMNTLVKQQIEQQRQQAAAQAPAPARPPPPAAKPPPPTMPPPAVPPPAAAAPRPVQPPPPAMPPPTSPPPAAAPLPPPPMPPPDIGPPEATAASGGEEPEAKRARTDGGLIPEADFVAAHPGEVAVSVQCPSVDATASLNGQVLAVSVTSLMLTVGALKELVAGDVGVGANKLRLSSEAEGLLREELTLAHYNVGPEVTLQLSLKERGGRKK